MNFIKLFTRRPVTTIMLFSMFLLFGGFSYFQLAKDNFPPIDVPWVTVITVYPGAGPEEVESQITEKIEEAVASVSGLKSQNSISQEGLSIVAAEFELDVDGDVAEANMRSEVDQVINDLPDDADRPITAQFDLSSIPIGQVAVMAPRPVEEIYQIVDNVIADRFKQISGLAQVEVAGGKEREIVISVSSKKLEAFGLSILDVDSMISSFNIKLPAGRIIEGEQEINVKLQGEFESLDVIRSLEIPTSRGIIRLADVATIEDSFEEIRSMARMNGKTAVGLSLTKSSDANTVEIMRKVRKELAKLEQELPQDFELILAKDASTSIEASVNDVFVNLGIGILLTAGVLFLFLHNVRLTLIATVTLPIAVISTFALMSASGFSANMMSLMALALSVGVLVANTIVVLENIQRHLEESGDEPLLAAEAGTSEIMIAVLGSALTNMAVFLPLATMGGMVGRIFPQFGFTTVYATLFSLLLSFTLTPMLASKLLKRHTGEKPKGPIAWFGRGWEAMFKVWEKAYAATLKGVLRVRWLTVFVTLVLLVSSFSFMKWIGGEFMPQTDQGLIQIEIEKAVDESIEGTSYSILTIEERLQNLPYVKQFYTTIGGEEGSDTGVNEGKIMITMIDREQREISSMDAAMELRALLADIPGVRLTIQATSAGPGSGEKPLSADVRGQNMDDLFAVAGQILEIMRQEPGTADVDMNWRLGKQELQVTPDYRRCADYGITSAQLAMMLRTYFSGSVGSKYRVDGEEYDIRVQLSEEERADASNLEALPIQTPKGMVRLDSLARVEFVEGPSKIYRSERMRSVTAGANIATGFALANIQANVQRKIDELELPQGVTITWGGDTEMMMESLINMSIALFLAIAVTYMLLSILLESAIHSLTIMSTLPLALIGVLASLAITGKTLNIFSMMGVIMLVGIVVNNGIILIDYIEELRRKGKRWRDAVVPACAMKLRPILMTNVAIMCSMVPMALGLGQGGEMRAPMAIVSIGGIFSSTFMTLYVVPVLYSLIESVREFLGHKKRRKTDVKKKKEEPIELQTASENV
ncbi:acriflavin resistance protein [candidate division KSB3 bacterium]|uniref:Acriflavin resistance protein n=1 Tax=candidate division KSB3 bacterium TaxID=2044937 RepID=A0A2G6KGR6_9BACT|nr:MAG: acriflavin resistance protein [candidate division KSB3 bacterium]